MNIPLLQSKAWEKLQQDLSENTIIHQGNDYQFLAILKNTPLGNYLYVPYGPVATDKTSFKAAIKALTTLADQTESIFIRVEPQNPDFISSFPKNTHKSTDLNPKETWILDLKNGELKDKLPERLVRYHKNADKNDLTITTSHNPEDIKYLIELQTSLAKKKGINTFSEEYLKTELAQPFATLYLVYKQAGNTDGWRSLGAPQPSKSEDGGKCDDRAHQELVAAGLVFDDKTTRYNLQGAQSEQGRKLHATGILTIQLINDAKEKGLKTFDFWGIAPENAPKNHPWAGFTGFKKTFKGEQVNYAGTYDIVVKPVKYRLYQLTRKINRLLRKV